MEALYLKKHDFTLIQSGIPDTTEEQPSKPIAMQTFITDTGPRAKIIYCEPGTEKKVADLAGEFPNASAPMNNLNRDIQINCKEIKTLRALKEQQLFIISDLQLVRGVDYRSVGELGIDLLIAYPLPTARELKQLKGRVGRYNEPCARFHIESLTQETLVDKANERNILGNIHRSRM